MEKANALNTQKYSVGKPILQVSGVNQVFDGRIILRDVTFQIDNIIRPDVKQGQVFAILGRSGAGKTTLANIISGLLKPTSGEVLINEEATLVRQGEVGLVYQNYFGYDDKTVEQSLFLAAYQGMFHEDAVHTLKDIPKRFKAIWISIFNKKILREKVDTYLDMFDLREHLKKYPSQLSGGQTQRLAILMQILCSSRYIILDEPFSGQDPENKKEICTVIENTALLDEFQTLGIITHDIGQGIRVSDKLLIMGREVDQETHKKKPGNTVFEPYDLAKHGLAWQGEEVCRTKEFMELVDEITYEWFPNL
jgi:ABC-type multidrug transport system ATPase subunit